jgi:hypothetical protein
MAEDERQRIVKRANAARTAARGRGAGVRPQAGAIPPSSKRMRGDASRPEKAPDTLVAFIVSVIRPSLGSPVLDMWVLSKRARRYLPGSVVALGVHDPTSEIVLGRRLIDGFGTQY